MADRKYRHQGYRSQDAGPRRPSPSPPDGPRSGGMLAKRTVSRCGACPHGRADLHACRQCGHFDPGQRFECGQPIPERVADKNVRNECGSFSLRVTIERDASPDSTRPGDIRRGFDDLFKK